MADAFLRVWVDPFQDNFEMAAYRVVAGAGSPPERFDISDDKGAAAGFQNSTRHPERSRFAAAGFPRIAMLARYDSRHQQIVNGVYLQNSYRAMIGISFSPADIPLSFH